MSSPRCISFIIPVCGDSYSGRRVIQRLGPLAESLTKLGAEVVVADASRTTARRIEMIARGRGCVYVQAPRKTPFAPGLTRDAGVQVATRKNVFLFDVDLLFPPTFRSLLAEPLGVLDHCPISFQMLPCLYLTRQATGRVELDTREIRALWQGYLCGRFADIINLAVASSAIIVRRDHYLAMGGHRPEYAGHGCEDLDFIFRLTQEWPMGAWGTDLYDDVRQESISGSQGFRKYFSYYGLTSAFHGLVLAHRWHPRPAFSRYFRRRPDNDRMFQDFMRGYVMHGEGPPALPDLNVCDRTLVTVARDVDDVQSFRQFLPELGKYQVVKADEVYAAEEFTQIFYVGMPPPEYKCGSLPTSVRKIGSLVRQTPDGPTWQLQIRDLSGEKIRDELHTGLLRRYADGSRYRWLFHRGVNRFTGGTLYDFVPPDYACQLPLPPLEEHIHFLMQQAGDDPRCHPGLFMNQWAQMPASHRFLRKFRKLVRDPAAFWRDSAWRRSSGN